MPISTFSREVIFLHLHMASGFLAIDCLREFGQNFIRTKIYTNNVRFFLYFKIYCLAWPPVIRAKKDTIRHTDAEEKRIYVLTPGERKKGFHVTEHSVLGVWVPPQQNWDFPFPTHTATP